MVSDSAEVVKESLALLVRSATEPERVLLVQRPEDDPELPGLWGLPAISLHEAESDLQALERLAATKLGLRLREFRFLCAGHQQRPTYRLHMRLYEALLPEGEIPRLPERSGHGGMTLYQAWRWGSVDELRQSAAHGSLCSQLALDYHAHTRSSGIPGGALSRDCPQGQ